jgi:hypothetical protein
MVALDAADLVQLAAYEHKAALKGSRWRASSAVRSMRATPT